MLKEAMSPDKLVMDRIHNHKIKMRSKMFFVVGSLAAVLWLVASMLTSVFLVGLIRFSLRTHGPMGAYRLDQILSSFPWWALLIAVLGLVVGIGLMRRYDFSYKFNFKIIVVCFVTAVIISGWLVDVIGLNDVLFRQGPRRGLRGGYSQLNKNLK